MQIGGRTGLQLTASCCGGARDSDRVRTTKCHSCNPGRVVYEGYRSLESSQELPTILGRQGVYVGRIDRAAFAKIVNMAVRRGIVGQDGHFSAGIDAEYTSITLAGSAEYGGEATRPLIEEIDSLLSGLVWREAGEAHR